MDNEIKIIVLITAIANLITAIANLIQKLQDNKKSSSARKSKGKSKSK